MVNESGAKKEDHLKPNGSNKRENELTSDQNNNITVKNLKYK
jgi:hypothetical protein